MFANCHKRAKYGYPLCIFPQLLGSYILKVFNNVLRFFRSSLVVPEVLQACPFSTHWVLKIKAELWLRSDATVTTTGGNKTKKATGTRAKFQM